MTGKWVIQGKQEFGGPSQGEAEVNARDAGSVPQEWHWQWKAEIGAGTEGWPATDGEQSATRHATQVEGRIQLSKMFDLVTLTMTLTYMSKNFNLCHNFWPIIQFTFIYYNDVQYYVFLSNIRIFLLYSWFCTTFMFMGQIVQPVRRILTALQLWILTL